MAITMTVTPEPIGAGQLASVKLTGLDTKARATITTVDDQCTEVGLSTKASRADRNGNLVVGVVVPRLRGKYRIRVYQRGVVVKDFLGTVT